MSDALDPVLWYRVYFLQEMKMSYLTRGQLAERAEVGVETIRYYERRGLLRRGLLFQPERSNSGYRQFPPDVVERLRFIQKAQRLGFSLEEIKELLSLRIDPESSCENVRRRVEGKIAEIEEKVKVLRRMRRALVKQTEACEGSAPVTECPILEALE
jgi:MerR family mercuric resistance operon transcriptional regulator